MKYYVTTHETATLVIECEYEVEAEDFQGMMREIDQIKEHNPVRTLSSKIDVKVVEFHVEQILQDLPEQVS